MKKIIIAAAIVIAVLGTGGYLLYRSYMTDIIARAVVSDSLPPYIPKRLQTRIEIIRKPLNKGTEAMLQKMHASRIPLDRVLEAVDKTTEDDANAFLDELNNTQLLNSDQVFDIAKKHFPADFDVEVFRGPFKEHFQMNQIRGAIALANKNRKEKNIDIKWAREILKKIIADKDREMTDPAPH